MYKFTNNAATLLAASVTVSDGAITVTSGTGVLFPALALGDSFLITVQSAAQFEIMECTARSGDTFTVLRGADNTDAQVWGAGASVTMRIPAAALNAFAQRSEISTLGNKVNRTGDIMTGDLAIQRAFPTLYLRKTASSGQEAYVIGALNNIARWAVILGDNAAEAGGNSGSHFRIARYNDGGAYLNSPILIDRPSGVVYMDQAPYIRTRSAGDNSEFAASTAFVQSAIALGVVGPLALKANLASPVFTGVPQAPTAAYPNVSDTLATTHYVKIAIDNLIALLPSLGFLTNADFTGVGRQVLGPAGFQVLPGTPGVNRLIIQWANVGVGSGGTVWTFPVAFPNACIFIGGNANGAFPPLAALGPNAPSLGNCALDFADAAASAVLVMAIGY